MTVQSGAGTGDGAGNGDGAGSNGAGTGDSANQNQNQNQNGGGANGNSNANNQNQNGDGGGSTFDPEKDLTKEQWEAIYGSGRFKQLNADAKKGRDLQKQMDDAEAKRLADEGKWQDLADKNAQTAERYKNAALNSKVEAVAAKLGSVDPEAVAALIDKSGISIDDNLNVTGAEAAVNALKESKPYLFNSDNNNNNSTTRVGSPSNPSGNNTGYKFKMSEIRDPKFYNEHKEEIRKAMANGQIDKNA
jgi:hypothetical protein